TVVDPNSGNNSATDTDTLVPTGDLSVTVNDGTATAVPGTSTTYTIVVQNPGPSDITGATLTDLFPAGISGDNFTSMASGGATGNTRTAGGDLNVTRTLPAGSSVTYTVIAHINPAATGTLTDMATVTAPGTAPDPNTGNNTNSDIDTLNPTADLSV